MVSKNTNRANFSWSIENHVSYWSNHFAHKVTIQVSHQDKEAEYECTLNFKDEMINEEKYWQDFGIKIAELMDNIELVKRISTVKAKRYDQDGSNNEEEV